MKLKNTNWVDFIFMLITTTVGLTLLIWMYVGYQQTKADETQVPDLAWKNLTEATQILENQGFQQFEFTEQGTGKFLGNQQGFYTKHPNNYKIVRQVPKTREKASQSGANLRFYAYREGSTEYEREKIARDKK